MTRLMNIVLVLTVLPAVLVWGQKVEDIPQGFNYQAVARDSTGQIIKDADIALRISLLEGSVDGNEVYHEIHRTRTNKYGLVNLVVGRGNFVSGNFTSLDWGAGPFFIMIEMDMAGGSDYDLMGVSQLMSVPYAMHAETSGNGISDGPQTIAGTKTFTSPIEGNLEGGVVLTNNAPEVPGALRWTGTDFQGFDGTKWVSLTVGGGAINEDTSSYTCGEEIVDKRDGNTYRTVLIGTQCWTQDNLNYNSGEGSFAGSGDYDPSIVGRYYTWSGAMDIDLKYDEEEYPGPSTGVTGVCPAGWHLPSHEEYLILESVPLIDGISLQQGNASGFEAILAGDRLTDGTFANAGISAIFWTSSQASAVDAWKRIIFDGEAGIGVFVFVKTPGFSVRCIKD